MPAVAVTLNGKGPFTLGIDTGAPGYLHVSKAVAVAAGLTATGSDLVSDPSGRNPVTVSRYRVDVLTLGGLAFHDFPADDLPMPSAGVGPPLEGVLGMDLFDALTLTLDFRRRQVATSAAPLPAGDGVGIVGYEPGPLIQLAVQIGDVTLPTHLDTGQTRAALIVPQEMVGRLATRGSPRKIGAARTISQNMELYSIALDAPVRVAQVRLPVAEVAYPTVIPIANLGSAALQQMVVVIDRPNKRVQFVA
jgi:predicted aspartyl protease